MFIVIEIMKTGEQISTVVTQHSTKLEAKAKFFQAVGAATQSPVDRHHISILTETGKLIMNDGFDHYEEEV